MSQSRKSKRDQQFTKSELIKARELIRNKKYEDARAILITLNHPTANHWLERLPPPIATEKPDLATLGNSITQLGCALTLLCTCSFVFLLLLL